MTAGRRADGLIATKLNAPEGSARTVSRSACFAALSSTEEGPAMLGVVAPAGFGKSTLLSELCGALRGQGFRTCWISLDVEDNSPATFANYFIAALRNLEVGARHGGGALQSPNPARDFEVLFNRLLTHVSGIRGEVAIFIDDFQFIHDAHIIAFINRLLGHAPKGLRLVIASREALPLELARLRVSGRLIELDQQALSFDVEEARAFLLRGHGLELAAADLERLLEVTEGWPAGLQLAALALREHAGPASELIGSFSGRDRDLASYLLETVLNSQPEPVRRFLLLTAPLRRMCAPLCAEAAGHADSAAMLQHLCAASLFLISLDREGHWYRYHHLFGEFLQGELRRRDPQAYVDVCDRASHWYQANGYMTAAIQYALDGEQFERACDLIAAEVPRLAYVQGDHYTVLEWMRRLPEVYHERRPEILLSHAWTRAFCRDSEMAITMTDRVLRQLPNAEDGWQLSHDERRQLELQARVTQIVAMCTEERIEETIREGTRLRGMLTEDDPFLISSVDNAISYCLFLRGDLAACISTAVEAYAHGQRAGAPYASICADFLHGIANLRLGRLGAARELGARAAGNAQQEVSTKSYSVAMAALLNADAALQRCDFTAAGEYMKAGGSFSILFSPLEPVLMAIRNDARIHAWQGDIGNARRILAQGQDMAISTGQSRLFFNLAVEEALLRLNSGDVSGALDTVRRTGLRRHPHGGALQQQGGRRERNALRMLDARLQLAADDAAAALRTLSLLQHEHDPEAGFGLLQTIRAVRAMALWQQKRTADALRELDKALGVASAELHAYPIAAAGPGLLPLLRAIGVRRGDAPVTVELQQRRALEQRLIMVLSGEPVAGTEARAMQREGESAVASGGSTVVDALTERETELLRLVEAGLPNRQLADALLISEGTVKWHLHNIYNKLGVRNRTAAASRARELAMI